MFWSSWCIWWWQLWHMIDDGSWWRCTMMIDDDNYDVWRMMVHDDDWWWQLWCMTDDGSWWWCTMMISDGWWLWCMIMMVMIVTQMITWWYPWSYDMCGAYIPWSWWFADLLVDWRSTIFISYSPHQLQLPHPVSSSQLPFAIDAKGGEMFRGRDVLLRGSSP